MSLGKDVADFNTTTSVYYVHMQYSLICHSIVLFVAFFILPMPREIGIDGVARLVVGGLLYIGFAALLVYAPKLLHATFIGRWFAGDTYEAEARKQFAQMSETNQIMLEEPVFKILAQQDQLNLKKKQNIAINIFFQCLLVELFCLVVLINKDHSLMISNHVTQNIAEFLQQYAWNEKRDYRYKYGFALTVSGGEGGTVPFSQYAYMAESIFLIYIIFMISCLIRLVSMFIFSRPLFVRDDVFSFLKKGRYVWAILGTLIMFVATLVCLLWIVGELSFYIGLIEDYSIWIHFSAMMVTVMLINFLIFFRFMEDWYKLIFRKF